MKKTIFILTALITSAFMISCTTIREIPEDKTPAQIIQMGQNAASLNDNKNAINCFSTAIDRFGSDPKIYVEAKYELAHTYSKQKNYDKAYPIYVELLDLYASNTAAFPPAYKKLCQIEINKIPEAKLKDLEAKNQ